MLESQLLVHAAFVAISAVFVAAVANPCTELQAGGTLTGTKLYENCVVNGVTAQVGTATLRNVVWNGGSLQFLAASNVNVTLDGCTMTNMDGVLSMLASSPISYVAVYILNSNINAVTSSVASFGTMTSDLSVSYVFVRISDSTVTTAAGSVAALGGSSATVHHVDIKITDSTVKVDGIDYVAIGGVIFVAATPVTVDSMLVVATRSTLECRGNNYVSCVGVMQTATSALTVTNVELRAEDRSMLYSATRVDYSSALGIMSIADATVTTAIVRAFDSKVIANATRKAGCSMCIAAMLKFTATGVHFTASNSLVNVSTTDYLAGALSFVGIYGPSSASDTTITSTNSNVTVVSDANYIVSASWFAQGSLTVHNCRGIAEGSNITTKSGFAFAAAFSFVAYGSMTSTFTSLKATRCNITTKGGEAWAGAAGWLAYGTMVAEDALVEVSHSTINSTASSSIAVAVGWSAANNISARNTSIRVTSSFVTVHAVVSYANALGWQSNKDVTVNESSTHSVDTVATATTAGTIATTMTVLCAESCYIRQWNAQAEASRLSASSAQIAIALGWFSTPKLTMVDVTATAIDSTLKAYVVNHYAFVLGALGDRIALSNLVVATSRSTLEAEAATIGLALSFFSFDVSVKGANFSLTSSSVSVKVARDYGAAAGFLTTGILNAKSVSWSMLGCTVTNTAGYTPMVTLGFGSYYESGFRTDVDGATFSVCDTVITSTAPTLAIITRSDYNTALQLFTTERFANLSKIVYLINKEEYSVWQWQLWDPDRPGFFAVPQKPLIHRKRMRSGR